MKNNMPVHPFKDSRQDSQEETKYREKCHSQVKCNLEKVVSRVEQEHETVYLTHVLVIVLMITNTPLLQQGRQKYIYVIISFLYIQYVSD